MARTLTGDFRRLHERVRSRVLPALRNTERWWDARALPVLRAVRGQLPWQRVVVLFAAFSLVVAVVPAVRWPVLRLAAGTATSLSAPVRPSIDGFDTLPNSTRVLDRNGELIAELDAGERRIPKKLEDLPDHVIHAVLAAEDRNFFRHPGIDPIAVVRAAVATAGGSQQGGSTVTQQLAKLNFTGGAPTLLRKVEELGYAAELERQYSKEELLQRYLNQVYFGDGAYGIGAAAKAFFGREATELTVAQAAMLAGKIRAPDGLDPDDRPDAVQARRDQVIDLMASEGWLTEEEATAAKAEPLGVERTRAVRPPVRSPWFVEYVKREAVSLSELGEDPETRLHRLLTGGFTVETTLDLPANDHAAHIVSQSLDRTEDPTAAVVSVDPDTGAIRMMVGGRNFEEQRFNAAAQARRQPGSAFKPFVYLAALEEGIDPRSTLAGWSPREFEFDGRDFRVRNYGDNSYGSLTLDDALVRSVNTAYMELGLEVGPDEVVEAARKAGLDHEFQPVPAAALGGINPGVTPLEMASAYGTFAAGGVHAQPFAIARIVDGTGHVLYEREVERSMTLDRRHVGVLNRALLDVVGRGTGRAAALPGRDVAGKTGTTSDHRDAWFIGFTPQLATAVWVGHLDNSPMTNVHGLRISGGSFPARIFGEVMEAALAGTESEEIVTTDPRDLDLEIRRSQHVRSRPAPDPAPPPEEVEPTDPGPALPVPPDPVPVPEPAPPPEETTTTAPAPKENGGGAGSDDEEASG